MNSRVLTINNNPTADQIATYIMRGEAKFKCHGEAISLPTPQQHGTFYQQKAYATQAGEKILKDLTDRGIIN